METLHSDTPGVADIQFDEIPPDPRVARERRLVRIIIGGVLVILVAAAFQAVGPDVAYHGRRWMGVRVIADSSTESTLTKPPQQFDAPDVKRFDPTLASAADAQISPPKRKARTAEQLAAVASDVDINSIPNEPVVEVRPNADKPANTIPPDSKPDMPLDSNEALLETAAQLVNQSWQDFAYPIEWQVPETSKTRMLYSHHRNRVLKAIAHTSPNTLSLDMARKDYAAARGQFADDPRLDYAFGLVLWKHGQFGEAIDMFQTAARLNGVPFLPAALAVAWGRMLNGDERRGLDQLSHVARVLSSSRADYPPETQKEQAALSLGRAIGYLSGPGGNPDLTESVKLTSINIRDRLPENLREAYDSGHDQVGQRQSELLQLTDLPHDKLHADHQSRQEDLQSRINDLRQQMKDSRHALTRNRLSRVDAVKDILKEALDVRGQMEKLQPTIKQLKESLWKLNKPAPQIVTKTMPGHMHLVVTPSSNGQPGESRLVQNNATYQFNRGETASERAARVSKLNKVRDDLKKIDEDLAKLRDQQQDLLSRRRTEDLQHKREQDAARLERVSRLDEQRDLEKKLQQLNKALRRTLSLREGVDTIAAYIPWNIGVEGEALWLALTAKPNKRTP